jgi:nucleotide-binding universal stress UspA family protein
VKLLNESEVIAMQVPESRTILVGVDGSQSSIEALRWAAMLASRLGTTITAAMAWRHVPEAAPFVTGIPERPPDDIEHLLVEQLRKAVDTAGLMDVERLPLRGTAHVALQQAASQREVALLVVGTRGLGPITGLLLGSVSRKLLFSVTCPLVLVPSGGGREEIDRVVVGVDGSPVSDSVTAWSAVLCSRLGAAATVVHCIEAGAEHSSERLDEIVEVSQLSFERDNCAVFRGLGVPHEPVVKDGDPRICLIEKAESHHAGLIVVGQHGDGQLAGLGGTVSYLVRHSPIPLAVIPKPHEGTAHA